MGFGGIGAAFYPEHYPRGQWRDYVELMPGAGIAFVRMLEFAWDRLEPREGRFDFGWVDDVLGMLDEVGVKALLCTPTATPPVWAYDRYPDIGIVDRTGRYHGFAGRRNTCPTSRSYRRLSEIITSEMARRYGDDPRIIGWQIDNEIGHPDCYCDGCLKAFRRWCGGQFDSPEHLNEACVMGFWAKSIDSFDEMPLPVDHNHFSIDMLYRRFFSDRVVDCWGAQADWLRRGGAVAPITTNMMGTWYAYDHEKLAEKLDVISVDHYALRNGFGQDFAGEAFINAFFRGVGHGRPVWFNEFQGGASGNGERPLPGQVRMWMLQQVGLGADQISFFRWETCRSGAERANAGILHPSRKPSRIYHEIAGATRELDQLAPLLEGTESAPAEVAVLYSFEAHGEHAIRMRNPAFDAPCGNGYSMHLSTHYRALVKQNVPVDVVYPRDDFGRYRLIVVPAMYCLTEAVAEKLTGYIERGGRVLLTSFSGVVDINARMFDEPIPGPLHRVFGVEIVDTNRYMDTMGELIFKTTTEEFKAPRYALRRWIDEVQPTDDTDVLATFEGVFFDGAAALTRRRVGRGEAWYLGTLLEEHDYETFYAEMLERMSINPMVPVAEAIGVSMRVGPDRELLFVSNPDVHPHEVDLPEGWVDALSEIEISGVTTVPPFDVLVLKTTRNTKAPLT